MGARALEILEAVGLLRRSETDAPAVGFLTGTETEAASALRALASDAAVGAKSPDPGVFGRGADEGVFGRVMEGVLERAGVDVTAERWPAEEEGRGLAGVGVGFAWAAGLAVTVNGVEVEADIVEWNEVGGDRAGVRAGVLPPAPFARLLRAAVDLEGVVGVRPGVPILDCRCAIGFGTGTAVSFGGLDVGSVVAALSATEPGAVAGSGARSGLATGGEVGGGDLDFSASSEDGGDLGLGGHSRFSFASTFTASPAISDAVLDGREDTACGVTD